MYDLLVWFGVIFLIGVAICIIGFVWSCLEERIWYWKRQHFWKHRMDGKPIAKCRCYQCSYWTMAQGESERGYCNMNDKYTPDYFFCQSAKHETIEHARDNEWREELFQ